MSISVAIVGSGPSGFYTAGELLRAVKGCQIDVIDRLPAPFGLVRYGIAPDHQSTKNVQRLFDKTARDTAVRYFGNVEIGKDVSLHELRACYDAVVLAVGAPLDRPLGVKGEDKLGVYGSAAFVGWYNGHPDFRHLDPLLDCRAAAVIGNGNVALDIARLLVRTRAELEASDMPDFAVDAIARSPLTDVYVFGRRGPMDAKFTIGELREMGELEDGVALVDAAQLPETLDGYSEEERRARARNIEIIKAWVPNRPAAKRKRVHFAFYASPVEVLGDARVRGLRLERTRVEGQRAVGTGQFFEVECGFVAAAIGYRSPVIAGAPFDEKQGLYINDDGRIGPGLYAVGWAMRGPTGVVGTNRADGKTVSAHIAADLKTASKPGRPAFQAKLAERAVRVVDYADWLKLEAAEVKNARPKAPRRKFVELEEVLRFLATAPSGA
ncbi:MAG: hypothetical protein FJX68_11840 [Alphaproteobacteria bacterium]|nr:hypothetical protein [Alphaproteobacteria bacterium]